MSVAADVGAQVKVASNDGEMAATMTDEQERRSDNEQYESDAPSPKRARSAADDAESTAVAKEQQEGAIKSQLSMQREGHGDDKARIDEDADSKRQRFD